MEPSRVGIDGCPGGWLAVMEQLGRRLETKVFPGFADLIAQLPATATIGVDIPIGLPEKGARSCETQARQLLRKPRSNSVFSAPPRACVAAQSYVEACDIRFRIEGKRMSRQAFGILPKVREVDAVVSGNAVLAARVLEVHPEVSFALWNGGAAMAHKKKSVDGKAERRSLIEGLWPGEIDRARETLRGADYALDDLHDAFAALWTVRRWVTGTAQVLGDPKQRDSKGLAMRIVA